MHQPGHKNRLAIFFRRAAALIVVAPSIVLSSAGPVPQKEASLSPPVVMSAEQDHQRMMELLQIKSLRPGANPNDAKAPNAVNYDESKANPYPRLPDPLLLKNGRRVTSKKVWWSQRRPELVEDFDREVYGRVPRNVPKVNWEGREYHQGKERRGARHRQETLGARGQFFLSGHQR
jgi:hypothetical protein